MVAGTPALNRRLAGVHPRYRESARNLLQYLALRRHDIRPLQMRLAALGLSSLGRAEPHVLATVDTVIDVLRRLDGKKDGRRRSSQPFLGFDQGRKLLDENTRELLGAPTPGRSVRIMVTMPSEAADDYLLVHNLLENGMNCMRINCAHDGPETWLGMIEHLRRAEETLGRTCTVVMDLGGPKLRTGPVEPGPAVVKARPGRDPFGAVISPARIWLVPESQRCDAPSRADATLCLPDEWVEALEVGDRISLRDVRGARRTLRIADSGPDGCWAEARRTIYFAPGIVLKCKRFAKSEIKAKAAIGEFDPPEGSLTIRVGDELIVTRDQTPGRSATFDSAGQILTPATIGCTLPEVFDDVRPGEPIWFDDGKIGGVIEKIDDEKSSVRITRARAAGEKLRGDKGINLPESKLKLPAMTSQDIEDLKFVANYADVVELSFANSARDVALLQKHLERLGGLRPAIVLKIETRRGFENLPEMLLTAMRSPCCGVMIARGDLAVECGFERLAEVQEEILWICEAAHVPVIWATQVLESLAKEGMPSRAEITDAAMGDRAECVMLNKGPHVVSAVRVLDHILRRMQAHQTKKRAMLRELRLAHVFKTDERTSPASKK